MAPQSTKFSRAGSGFFGGTPLPEHWRKSADANGKAYYYHEITQATVYDVPPALPKDWKITRDIETGKVYFYNTITRATMPFNWNPPGGDAAATALRTGLPAPPPGPPPQRTKCAAGVIPPPAPQTHTPLPAPTPSACPRRQRRDLQGRVRGARAPRLHGELQRGGGAEAAAREGPRRPGGRLHHPWGGTPAG